MSLQPLPENWIYLIRYELWNNNGSGGRFTTSHGGDISTSQRQDLLEDIFSHEYFLNGIHTLNK